MQEWELDSREFISTVGLDNMDHLALERPLNWRENVWKLEECMDTK